MPLQNILLLSEKERISWKNKEVSFYYANFLDSATLAKFVFSFKGVIMDSIAEDRALALTAGSSVESAAILQKIKTLQGRLSKISFEQGKEADAAELQDELGKLQRELTTKLLGRDRQRISASITMADIMP